MARKTWNERENMRTAHVITTVERKDGTVTFERWQLRDGTIRRLVAKLKRRYAQNPDVAHVGYGAGYYVNSYGAH